jgi:hypothetical protein
LKTRIKYKTIKITTIKKSIITEQNTFYLFMDFTENNTMDSTMDSTIKTRVEAILQSAQVSELNPTQARMCNATDASVWNNLQAHTLHAIDAIILNNIKASAWKELDAIMLKDAKASINARTLNNEKIIWYDLSPNPESPEIDDLPNSNK